MKKFTQLVHDKHKGLYEIEVSESELHTEVKKNYTHELSVKWKLKDGTPVIVLASGAIIYDKNQKQINYSYMVPTYLTPDGQTLKLQGTDEAVHQIVVDAFYTEYYGKDFSHKNKVIHHKDNNALNNQLWNLIVLDSETHGAIPHSK